MGDDLRGAALLAGLFLALLGLAELWRRLARPDPEHTRKLVHVAGGLVCLLFPFLVDSPWVVLALASALTGLFVLAARFGGLRSLHGVARASRGAELFPLAVFIVYLLARDRPWLYVAALLVLAVGDAAAALVGVRYGAVRFEVEESPKSLEGSLAFLVVAFLAIHLPMLLMTDLPRPVCVLSALLVALLVTGFEAISLDGTDNLFVPLAVVIVLGKITTKPLPEIAFQVVSMAAIFGVIAAVAWRRRSLNVGAAIAYALFAYGTWSLGSWHWALPPLVGLVGFVGARSVEAPRPLEPVRVRGIVRAVLVPFLLLALANGTRDFPRFYAPYLAACGVALAFGILGSPRPGDATSSRSARSGTATRALAAAGFAAALVALPTWGIHRPPLAALAGVLGSVAVGVLAQPALAGAWARRREIPAKAGDPPAQWAEDRFLCVALAAAAILVLQDVGILPAWSPVSTRALD